MKKLGLNLSKSEFENLGLALGGTDYGFSVADNASAFSNFYNNGKRADPYYIEEIQDPSGRVIYKHKQNPQKVFSTGTSYRSEERRVGKECRSQARRQGHRKI